MSARVIPRASRPSPEGAFEVAMSLGQNLPGKLGFICHRKLKRRICQRAQDTFAQVLADTGPGDLCIDLGANMGVITKIMARTGADVISFEPDPVTFGMLRGSVGDAANVTLHEKAAGERADRLPLHRSAKWSQDDPTRHNASASLVRHDHEISDENSVLVDVVDIPAFLSDLDRDVRILKMDIEGSEWELMEALIAHPVFSRIDCIFVQTHERVDPARYIPVFNRLQAHAESIERPYIDLYLV